MDFVADGLDDGSKLRILTVVDVFTRECLSVHSDHSLNARKVIVALERIASERGCPKAITVDNAPSSSRGTWTGGRIATASPSTAERQLHLPIGDDYIAPS